ncbi:MAG: hypothetical protein JXL97_01380 [Bacteroidales bacterium]|nr:hypothetical protein [Bacteroidales bacterium]
MKFKVGFATDDGKNMVDKHFGDAGFYLIYEISKKESVFVEKRENSSTEEDERFHGDPLKAGKIGQIMKGVQILCNKQFGKNIINMSKKFVPILFDIDNIDEAIKITQSRFDEIEQAWKAGGSRKHISFRTKNIE